MDKLNNQKYKRSLFEIFVDTIYWLQIVASPFFVGIIIGALIYFSNPTNFRLILGIIIAAASLIFGILWANRVWKKEGTSHYISRITASPDLDPDPKSQQPEARNDQ